MNTEEIKTTRNVQKEDQSNRTNLKSKVLPPLVVDVEQTQLSLFLRA